MQALHIGTIMEIARNSFPIFGSKFINQLLELIILLLRPPSLLHIKLIKRSANGSQITRIIDNPINKIPLLARTPRIVHIIDIIATEEFDRLF